MNISQLIKAINNIRGDFVPMFTSRKCKCIHCGRVIFPYEPKLAVKKKQNIRAGDRVFDMKVTKYICMDCMTYVYKEMCKIKNKNKAKITKEKLKYDTNKKV